jgi:hypothetical protein
MHEKDKKNNPFKVDDSIKSRHSRAGGNPGYRKDDEKNGFPFPRE